MSWIVTDSRKRVDPLNIKAADIDMGDICHALGNLCRFTGHCRRFYSVAEHCVRMVDWFFASASPQLKLAALLHDAAEAYIGDISAPMKYRTLHIASGGVYRNAADTEGQILTAIGERIGAPSLLTWTQAQAIGWADKEMLRIEAAALMADRGDGWACQRNQGRLNRKEQERVEEIGRAAGGPATWSLPFAERLDEILEALPPTMKLRGSEATTRRDVAPRPPGGPKKERIV